MANPYTDPERFLEWMPPGYIAQLSDDVGGVNPNSTVIQEALDLAAEELESGIMVRDDIPVPVINADGSAPGIVVKFVHDVALYNLLSRRGIMVDSVRENFDIRMTWLGEVVRRRKNIDVRNTQGRQVTKTTEEPLIDGGGHNRFDGYSF